VPVLVAHDAVDLSKFDFVSEPHRGKIITFTGGASPLKGGDVLKEAAKLLPDNIEVRFVSGRPYNEIPAILKSSDVLVLPNSGKDLSSSTHTSPMKLFEYMASGVPIVASDVPAIREVLNEQIALLVKPDDPDALAGGITKLLDNQELGERLALNAREKVREYTWDKRAEAVLGFIRGN
jgi:glycosyltransferase involved in cell wall biosynthesis